MVKLSRAEKEDFTAAQGTTELAGEKEVKLHLSFLSFPFLSFPFLSFPFLSFPFLFFLFLSFPFFSSARSEFAKCCKNFNFVERLRFKLLVLTKVLRLEGKKTCQDPSESLRVDRNYSPETCKVLRTIGFQPRF